MGAQQIGVEESKYTQKIEVSQSMLSKIRNQEVKRELWKAERDSVKEMRDQKDKELEFLKKRVARLEKQLKSNPEPQSTTNMTENDTITPSVFPEADPSQAQSQPIPNEQQN